MNNGDMNTVGSLKPGASYVYERTGGVVYAREVGAPAESRTAIGWDLDVDSRYREEESFEVRQLWRDIRRTAKTNQALQQALERVIILYELARQHDT